MGKNNKAQRTKNNARPSSSGRSAELLNNTPPQMLFGFTAVKDGAFSAVTLDDMDATVDTNFQMTLKKMSKKDSTTKMKALQEFSELVEKTDAETLKAVLPFWPRIYCLLAADGNHRVRESLHRAQLAVVRKAGRNIAPHLKQMIGPWFAAQHDMYPPAASAAITSFEQAFAQAAKQVQAIEFCQAEILAYVRDNLQQFAVIKQVESEEECRQQRALLASLQGYTLYLQKLPPEALLAATDDNAAIVQTKKFWKLAKHPLSIVRASWFSCLATLCEKSPHLLTSEASVAVLSSLDDADSTVLPLVWDAALHLITSSKNVWTHVSVDKLVLPKLWLLLRNSCNGCAAAILPCILPFISQLPAAVTVDNAAQFYDKLFDNFRQGFTHKMSVQSQSECSALAKCYVECCRYAVMKNQADADFCENVVEKQLVVCLSLSLTDARLNLLSAPLYSAASLLLQHWDRFSPALLPRFWLSLEPCVLTLDGDEKDSDWLMARRVELLLAVKCPREQRATNLRVTFNQAHDPLPSQAAAPTPTTATPDFTRHLSSLSTSLCLLLAPLPSHTALLARLAASCASPQLFAALAQPHTLEAWLSDWLEQRTNHGAAVVKLAMMAMAGIEETERVGLLTSLAQRCSVPTLCCLLRACLSDVSSPSVSAFLRCSALASLLTQLAQDGGAEATRTLVLIATGKDTHGELLISRESLCHLITLATSSPRLNLAVALVEAPLTDQSALSTLTLALFTACLRGQRATVVDAMARGAEGVARGGGKLLMQQAGAEVNTYLQNSCKSDNVTDVTRCSDSVWRLLTATSTEPSPDRDLRLANLLDSYLSLHASQYDTLAASFTQLCDNAVLQMQAVVRRDDTTNIVNQSEAEIRKRLDIYFSHSLLNAKLIARLFPVVSKTEVEIVSESDGNVQEESEEELEEVEVFNKPAIIDEEGEEVEDVDVNEDEAVGAVEDVTRRRESEKEEEETEEGSGVAGDLVKVLESHVLRLVSSVALSRSLATRYASTELNYRSTQRRAAMETTVIDMLQRLQSVNIQTFFTTMINIWQDFGCKNKVSVYGCLNSDIHRSATQLTSLFTDRVSMRAMKIMDRQVERCWECFDTVKPYDVLEHIPTRDTAELLYDCEVSDADLASVETCAGTAQYLTTLVPLTLTPAMWDFIFISVTNWMLSVRRSKRWLLIGRTREPQQTWLRSHRVALLSINTCKLLAAVKLHLDKHKETEGSGPLLEEWEAVFQPELRDILCQLFIDVCGSQLHVLSTSVLQQLHAALHAVDVTSYAAVDKLTEACLLGLRSRSLAVQYTAFHLLLRLSQKLVDEDAATEEAATDDSDSSSYNLHLITATLAACQPGVQHVLVDVRLGEQCDVTPHTTEATDVMGYLLAAHVMLKMCHLAHDSLTSQYAQHLRESDMLGSLLRDVLRLMPVRVLEAIESRSKSPSTALLFSTPANTALTQAWVVETTHHLACRVYWLLLSRMPAEVRGWWSGCEQRTLVERITTRFVSPALSEIEMQQVRSLATKQVNKYDNMKIKVRVSVREVTAVYTVDDARMELVIALPGNHPLGLVKIETPRNVVGTSQCRSWLMQLTMFLTCQNGSLWNGLSLWKCNLDKRFEGIEECYICFSVLSGSNFKLPKISCRTCKKKFHSACLLQWFSTSQKSTCPICRNLF